MTLSTIITGITLKAVKQLVSNKRKFQPITAQPIEAEFEVGLTFDEMHQYAGEMAGTVDATDGMLYQTGEIVFFWKWQNLEEDGGLDEIIETLEGDRIIKVTGIEYTPMGTQIWGIC